MTFAEICLIAEVRLSPAKATSVKADLDLKGIKTGANGDFNIGELASKMDTPQTNQLIVRSYQHLAKDRRCTLVFCVDLNHVNSLTDAFRRAGIDARAVSSFSTATHRKDTLAAFLNQEFPVLVNCEVLTEGADIPVVSFGHQCGTLKTDRLRHFSPTDPKQESACSNGERQVLPLFLITDPPRSAVACDCPPRLARPTVTL